MVGYFNTTGLRQFSFQVADPGFDAQFIVALNGSSGSGPSAKVDLGRSLHLSYAGFRIVSAAGILSNAPSLIAGDANHDAVVDFNDLLPLAQHYGGPGLYSDGDFTDDGQVSFDDLLVLAQNYGQAFQPPATASVPELAAAAVCAASIGRLLRRQRGR